MTHHADPGRRTELLVPTKRAAYTLISHSLGDDASVLVICLDLHRARQVGLGIVLRSSLASMMSSHPCTKRRLLCHTLRVLKLVRLRFAFRRNFESS